MKNDFDVIHQTKNCVNINRENQLFRIKLLNYVVPITKQKSLISHTWLNLFMNFQI